MQLIDELADLKWSRKVTKSDAVGSKAAELLDETDEGLEVLFDGDVEGVLELEVDWDCVAC